MEFQEVTDEKVFCFGDFRLYPGRRLLLAKGKKLRIGGRAMDLLTLLVVRHGDVLSRAELVAHAWPHTIVDESSLRGHIAALRRSLGESDGGNRYIATVPGRGYSFVTPVALSEPREMTNEKTSPTSPKDNLPGRISRIIGRAETINELAMQLPSRRFLTIVGHGGMGKTTVALAVAEQVKRNYANGAWFVDLAPLTDSNQVWAALGAVLGVSISPERPLSTLSEYVRASRLLLVLDNCEHVIELASVLVETVLEQAPEVHILATSREALNANGEWVHHLSPLLVPGTINPVSAAAALSYPAIELFVERAMASSNTFHFEDEDALVASKLCNQLDGLPLAIEFAAARVGVLGIRGVAHQLENRINVLSAGRRTALPRHRTLRALLDWSFDLLGGDEQQVFTRLGVFRGPFSILDAQSVVCDDLLDEDVVQDCVLNLVTKSLLTVERVGQAVMYRLLGITRSYAFARLLAGSDAGIVLMNHTRHMISLLLAAGSDWERLERSDWVLAYHRCQPDIRAAHQWVFSEDGDPPLGIELNLAYLPVSIHFPAAPELQSQCEQALTFADSLSLSPFQIQHLQAGIHFHDPRSANEDARKQSAWQEALEDAGVRGDLEHQLILLYWRVATAIKLGDHQYADSLSESSRHIAHRIGDRRRIQHAYRISALSKHYMGEHNATREYAKNALSDPRIRTPLIFSSQLNSKVSLGIVVARSDWMQGRVNDAQERIDETLFHAERDPVTSMCQVLALGSIPISLWGGGRDSARDHIQSLVNLGGRHGISYWVGWGNVYTSLLELNIYGATDELVAGILLTNANEKQRDHLATFDECLLVPSVLKRVQTGVVGWCAAEVLRTNGVHAVKVGDLSRAEETFRHAVSVARIQSALSWELRASTSLARLLVNQERRIEARKCLEPVYERLTQGRDSKDVISAELLLESIC